MKDSVFFWIDFSTTVEVFSLKIVITQFRLSLPCLSSDRMTNGSPDQSVGRIRFGDFIKSCWNQVSRKPNYFWCQCFVAFFVVCQSRLNFDHCACIYYKNICRVINWNKVTRCRPVLFLPLYWQLRIKNCIVWHRIMEMLKKWANLKWEVIS